MNFVDVLLIIGILGAAGWFLYKSFVKKQGTCAGCSGCSRSAKTTAGKTDWSGCPENKK